MELPIRNAPAGWRVSRTSEATTVEKVSADTITQQHIYAAAVVGCCPFLFEALGQWFSSDARFADILLRWQTWRYTFLIPVSVGLAMLARKYLNFRHHFVFTANALSVVYEHAAKDKRVELPRNRISTLLRYPSDGRGPQATPEGVSFAIDWRKPNGGIAHLYLGWFPTKAEDEWFTRLFESWTGSKARLGESDDGSDEAGEPTPADR